MSDFSADFAPFAARMTAEGLPPVVIDTFARYYAQLAAGETGLIPEADIVPAENVPDMEAFPARLADVGAAALPHTILLKLNGGLGTGMGLAKAKSLLTVKNGLTFLDVIARQAGAAGVPLVLMNSFSTRDDSLAALSAYPELQGPVPLDFLQHKVPKIAQDGLVPAECPADPSLEWCPPGHGDLYTALITSGLLETLLGAGYRYAFVSNSDNLGAVIDPSLLGYLVDAELPFLMEVADRSEADRKGGHLACRPDGGYLLRESAQCPEADMETFQDITRHRYFNTNSLWLDLEALRRVLDADGGFLGLPMIRNAKTVDPRDRDSTPVWQLETAMGSAIAVFEGAGAVRVPKSRFAPIKKCSDLLDVRSDNYVLTDDWRVVANPARTLDRAFVDLDSQYYAFVDDLERRFPHGPPSLIECSRLVVRGDVRFGRGVKCVGEVALINESGATVAIEDGTVIEGERRW
jgi:UTP--glucose-1-phosphate uridylyltransferase